MNLSTPSAAPPAGKGLNPGRAKQFRVTSGLTLFFSYVLLLIIFSVLSPYFLTVKNFVNIGQTMAVVGIVAIGETLVLLAGGVDLSVGSVAALTGVITGLLWEKAGLPIGVCAAAGVGTAAFVGLINGLLVTRLRINPLISTLATYSAVRGLAFVLTNAQMNQLNHPQFQFLGRGDIGGIPFSLIVMLVLYVIFIFVLRHTPFGRDLYAVGGNPVASRLAGIATRKRLLTVFILSGFFAGLGGIISASQLAAGTPQAATGLEFTVIAAVVLGGTSLAGGKGTLIGSLIGVFILRTLDNGLVLTNVSSYYQEVARGAVLILAVGFDQIRTRLESARKVRGQ
jgi:ribose/xylose/arabinose/galactoside ABC-type transport system permease subunit